MERYAIKAVFRKHKDGTIDALFPYEPEFDYNVQCYNRIGQHCIADYDHVMRMTKPASPDEYASLLAELTNHVGYDITVIKRANRARMLEAWRCLNKSLQAV